MSRGTLLLAGLVVVALIALLIWQPWATQTKEIPVYVVPEPAPAPAPTYVPPVDQPKPQLPPDMTFAPPGETDATDAPTISTPLVDPTDPYPDYGDQPSLSGTALSAIFQRPTPNRPDRDDVDEEQPTDEVPDGGVIGVIMPPGPAPEFLPYVSGQRLPDALYAKKQTISADIIGLSARVNACRDACLDDPDGCRVYSYNRENRRCWTAPTYNPDSLVNKSSWITYGRPGVSGFSDEMAGRYPEAAYANRTYTHDAMGCSQKCADDPECALYSFNPGNNRCWMNNTVPPTADLVNKGTAWRTMFRGGAPVASTPVASTPVASTPVVPTPISSTSGTYSGRFPEAAYPKDLKGTAAFGEKHCQVMCTNDANCKLWSYNPGNNSCWRMTSVPPLSGLVNKGTNWKTTIG